jgi:cytochrome P450
MNQPEADASTNPVPDWNPWSAQALADPHAAQAEVRQRCPFPFSDQQGGFTSITRYADIVKAALDTAHFRNGLRPKLAQPMPPLETDPPEHSAYRRLLQPHFSPPRMRKLEDQMRAFAVSLLEPLLQSGRADFAAQFSFVLPIRAFCFLLNLPDADWPRIKEMSQDAYTIYAHMPEYRARFDAANAALYAYAHEVLAGRRVQPRDPAEDIVTLLAQAKINDAPIADEVIVSIMRLLLTAGHESTTSTLGNCILYLAQHPEDQARLRAEPALIPAAIEEILRWDTPVMAMPRVVAEDVELAGHSFHAGESVYLLYASGNRDPDKFENADTCQLDRKPNPHLAFGQGIHTCMGAPLARVEIKVALEELLARTESFTLDGEVVRTVFHRRGVTALPLALKARP